MSCPIVPREGETVSAEPTPERVHVSFRAGRDPISGKMELFPTVNGKDIPNVSACMVARNADGTRTMTIELELE